MTRRRIAMMALLPAILMISLSACAPGGPPTDGPTKTAQLVIDTTFDIKTIDPGREYEPTGQILVKALYDTLLTFADNDTTKIIPDLATFTANDAWTEFTFVLEPGRKFSDNSLVTADDVVFSLQRLAGMNGVPAFLLEGMTITKVDDKTIKVTTEDSAPALPAIMTTPSAGILNSKVVIANGGTTNKNDAAEAYLNSHSAGSGPYILETLDVASQAVLVKNPAYNGPQKPTYDKIVLRNVEPVAVESLRIIFRDMVLRRFHDIA